MNAKECRQIAEEKQQSNSYLHMYQKIIQKQEFEEHEQEVFYNILKRMQREIIQATDKAKTSVLVECVYTNQRTADKVRKVLEYNGYNVQLLDNSRNPIKFINDFCDDCTMFFYKINW